MRAWMIAAWALVCLPACQQSYASGGDDASLAQGEHGGEDGDDDDDDHLEGPAIRYSQLSPADQAVASRVLILQSPTIERPTEVIGLIDVHEEMASQDEALNDLRAKAASLGADAVLGVEFHHGEHHHHDGDGDDDDDHDDDHGAGGGEAHLHGHTHLSGMAVRFRDLLQGRSYDVVGDLDIDGAMGGEEAAFAELRARARALHADLLINISFHHGDGTTPTSLRGTAIRFRN